VPKRRRPSPALQMAGLIVTGSQLSILHRDLIITLAARHKLPAIYYEKFFVSAGHERLRLNDRDDLQNRREPAIQLDKEQAIAVRKPDALMHHPAQPLGVGAQHFRLQAGSSTLMARPRR
jgi:hypothetical protein